MNEEQWRSQNSGLETAEGTTVKVVSEPKVFLRPKKSKYILFIALSLVFLATVVVAILWLRQRALNQSNQQNENPVKVQDIDTSSLADLPQGLDASDEDKIVVNGQLQANKGVVISPTTQPSGPSLGQIYFDSTTNQLNYYNGAGFLPLASQADVSSLFTQISTFTSGVLGNRVTSLQSAFGDLTLLGTGGLSVSVNGQSISLQLPQNLTTTSNPQFNGLSLSSLSANGVLYSDSSKVIQSVTTSTAGLCFLSTAGAPTFGSCSSGIGSAFLHGGNAFGATAVLGTTDNYGIDFIANNLTVASISNIGAVLFKNSTNSTTALQVQNANSDPVLTVSTVYDTYTNLVGNYNFEAPGQTTLPAAVSSGGITQSGNTVTGVSFNNTNTAFTAGMVGSTLTYNDCSTTTITGYSSATSITVSDSKTISSAQSYAIGPVVPPTGWTLITGTGSGTPCINVVNTPVYGGSGAMKVITTTNKNDGARYSVALAADKSYVMSMWIRHDGTTRIDDIVLGYQDVFSSLDIDCSISKSTGVFNGGTYTQFICSFKTTSFGGLGIYVRRTNQNLTPGGAFYVDDVRLYQTVGNAVQIGKIGTSGTGSLGQLQFAYDGGGKVTLQPVIGSAISGDYILSIPLESGTICTTSNASPCTTGNDGKYLSKIVQDTAKFQVPSGGYLYTFTNTNTVVNSGVLKLDNGTNTGIPLQISSTVDTTTSPNAILLQASRSTALNFNFFASGMLGINIGSSLPSNDSTFGDLSFGGGSGITRIINVLQSTASNTGGGSLNVIGGKGNGTGTGGRLTLQGGDGGGSGIGSTGGSVYIDAGIGSGSGTSGSILIGSTNNPNTINIGTSVLTGQILLGGTSQTGSIILGSSNSANTVSIGNGTGATTVNISNTNIGGAINVGTAFTTGSITIGGTTQSGTITLGQSTANGATINIGSASVGNGNSQSINIGVGAQVGSGGSAITIGSPKDNTANKILIQAGTCTILSGGSPCFNEEALLLTVGATQNTGEIGIGSTTQTGTIRIGRAITSASQSVDIQSLNGLDSSQTIRIGGGTSTSSGFKRVEIANGIPGTGTTNVVQIGTAGTTTGTVGITIGSVGVANHTTLIQGGNGAGAITLNTGGGSINLNATSAGTTNVGTGTGSVSVGNATGTFALTSNGGLNVTTGGVVTGVATLNGQTISATANFTGTVGVTTSLTVPSILSSGAFSITPGGAATIGSTGQSLTLQGNASTTLKATSGIFTSTLAFVTPTANHTFNLPDVGVGASDTICLLTLGNCAGSGSGVTTTGGTTNRVAKFTGAQSIGDSTITDDGTNVSISGDFTLQGGDITVGTTLQIGSLLLHDGNGQIATLRTADQTASTVITLPSTGATDTICLLTAANCGGAGSGNTLQTAYDNGNTITTSDARNLNVTLADTVTDSKFIVNILGTGNTFEVQNSGSPVLAVTNSGVGVGTATLGLAKLESVVSNSSITQFMNASGALGLVNTDQTINNWVEIYFGDEVDNNGAAAISARITDHINNYADLLFSTRAAGGLASRLTILSGGNVGIGDTTPAALFTVGTSDAFQVNSSGNLISVGANVGSGLLQGTGGFTLTGTTNINATGTALTNLGNSTGVLTVASGGASSWTNTSGNLSVSTATSGNISITSVGTLALSSTNFNVSSAGVVTLAGGQTIDVTTASVATPTSIIVQPGASTANAAATIKVQGGTGNGTNVGGILTLQGGTGGANSAGGAVNLNGGSAGGGNNNGGNVNITGGVESGSGVPGSVTATGYVATLKSVNVFTGGYPASVTAYSNGTFGDGRLDLKGAYNVNAAGGAVNIKGGAGLYFGVASPGGNVNITGGDGDNANGGSIVLQGGLGTVGGVGGSIIIDAGPGGGGGEIGLGSITASAITIGNSTYNSTINLNSGTGTIAIGTGNQARTINIGTGVAAQTINIGSTNTTSTSLLQGGSGGIGFNTGTAQAIFAGTNTLYVGNASSAGTNAAPTAFTIQGTGSSTAGTAGGAVTVVGGTGGNNNVAGGVLNLQGGAAGASSTGVGTISGAVALSTLNAGSASVATFAGGASGVITITSGNGGTGNTTGLGGAAGNITLQGGTGGTGGASAAVGGAGASVNILAGNGGSPGAGGISGGGGGSIALTSGNGSGLGSGGSLTLTSGSSLSSGSSLTFATSGFVNSGNITLQGGTAATNAATTGVTGGSGSSVAINLGAGAAMTGGTGAQTGGAAGNFTLQGAAGGAVSSTTAAATGGAGSSIILTAGVGGAETGAGAAATVGGAGGSITLTAANGGAVTSSGGTAGSAGNISLTSGNAGTGGATNKNGGALTLTSGNGNLAGSGGSLTLQGGSGGATGVGAALVLNSGNGGATSGNSGNLTLSVGTVTSGTVGTLTVGNSTDTNTILIGSAITASGKTQTIQIANGAGAGTAINVDILSGVGTAGTGQLTLGNNTRVTQIDLGNVAAAAARNINIGTGANTVGVDTINIGTGVTTVANGKTINIGSSTPSGAGTNTILIGSNVAGSSTTIRGNTTNIGVIGSGTSASTVNISNTTNGTSVQAVSIGSTANASNTSIIQGGTGATAIQLQTGAGGTIGIGNNAVANTINIATANGANNSVVSIGTGVTGASNTATVTVGSNNAAGSTTLIQGGNGATALQLQTSNAGSITIGTTTQTGAITVGNSTDSNTINIGTGVTATGKTLTINIGNAGAAGSTTNITVGSAIAGTLTVKSSATFDKLVTFGGHVASANTSGTTTIAAGAAACTTPTVMTVTGNDTAGLISITTGTGCAATGIMGTVTFANAYGSAPRVIFTPSNANASNLKYYNGASGTGTFTLDTNTIPTDATSYTYNYFVIQ